MENGTVLIMLIKQLKKVVEKVNMVAGSIIVPNEKVLAKAGE